MDWLHEYEVNCHLCSNLTDGGGLTGAFADSGGSSVADAASNVPWTVAAPQATPTAGDATFSLPGAGPSFLPQQGGSPGFDISKIFPAAVGGIGSLIGAVRGQGGATDKALKHQSASTQGLQSAGNQALGAYTSGQLTPTQQAAVDQFKKQQLAKWRQYLASAGIPESSAMADIEAKVNTDAQVYADKLLQQDFNNAYQAIGMSRGNLSELAKQQALQDAEQRKAWQEFMAQLAKIGGDMGPMVVGGNP